MTTVFPATPGITVPITGTNQFFPIHRIYCVGRNYDEHVREMGGEVGRDPPFFFMKPADALVLDGRFPYPTMSSDVHHEIELVVALGEGARVFGYAVGLDMTRRDLQGAAKKQGRPWDTAKGFDFSAPVSAIKPERGFLKQGAITLDVNGQRRQSGDLSEMIWPVEGILANLSQFFALMPGDLIFTGTPAGVGPVTKGDRLHGAIEGVGKLDVLVS